MRIKCIALAAAAALAVGGQTGVLAADAQYFAAYEGMATAASSEAVTEFDTGIDGITLTIGADTWSWKSDSKSFDNYTGYIAGKANPNTADGTGTYYEISLDDTVAAGEIEVAYILGADKKFYITDNGTALDDYNGITVSEKVTQTSAFNVEGGHTYDIYASGSKLSFYGFSYRVVDREADFKAEIEALGFDFIKGDNVSEDSIDSDLYLPQNYESSFGSCDVSWTSDMPEVIANNGTVDCQTEEVTVHLTGKFSVQEDDSLVYEKTYTLTTIADNDDNAAVEAAADALSLGDTSAVKSDITLPQTGKRSTIITWSSSDESVITAEGVVTRAPSVDKTAVLTAVITRNDASVEKQFTVTVKGYVPVTFDGYVYGDENGDNAFSPVDGGTIKAVRFTESISDKTGDEVLVCAVYSDGNMLKGVKIVNIAEVSSGVDEESRAEIDLPMDSTDTFKLMAFAGLDTITPLVDYVTADDTVSDSAVIYVVGDSTASSYDDKSYPRKGWAQLLGEYFDDVEVVDYALSGRSSKSFKTDTNYTTLQSNIKSGDYLIIQFGHNDSKTGDEERYTDPDGDRYTDGSYKNSLMDYVNIARNVGATPIIATSISRRSLSDSSLEKYVDAARELAEEIDAPLIDLYDRTNSWINEVGTESAKDMFNYVKAYDSRFIDYAGFASSSYYTTGYEDNTHINIYGADLISQWATEEMAEIHLPLAEKVNSHQAEYPLPSYADAVSVTVE